MANKMISLKLEACERLKAAKVYPGEFVGEVVLRATWPEYTVTARELVERCRERGPAFGDEELDRIEELKARDEPPEDEWAKH